MIKILFLAANPIDSDHKRLDEEIRSIDKKLRQADFRDEFEIVQHWAVQVSDLQDALLRHRPQIVHFSGHGTQSGRIILEDEAGRGRPVPGAALSELFLILKDEIRCVVLNACFSEEQARRIAGHIECVIGLSDAITDSGAIAFVASFYQALGFGRNLETAFRLGCNEIDLMNLAEGDKPRLLALRPESLQIVLVGQDKVIDDLVNGSHRKRLRVARELARIAQRSFSTVLVERSMGDPDPTIRHWINRALGRIGSSEALEALRFNVDDPDPFAALGAEDALKEIDGSVQIFQDAPWGKC